MAIKDQDNMVQIIIYHLHPVLIFRHFLIWIPCLQEWLHTAKRFFLIWMTFLLNGFACVYWGYHPVCRSSCTVCLFRWAALMLEKPRWLQVWVHHVEACAKIQDDNKWSEIGQSKFIDTFINVLVHRCINCQKQNKETWYTFGPQSINQSFIKSINQIWFSKDLRLISSHTVT